VGRRPGAGRVDARTLVKQRRATTGRMILRGPARFSPERSHDARSPGCSRAHGGRSPRAPGHHRLEAPRCFPERPARGVRSRGPRRVRLRRHAAPDRRWANHLAALHRRAHDPGAGPAWRRARARGGDRLGIRGGPSEPHRDRGLHDRAGPFPRRVGQGAARAPRLRQRPRHVRRWLCWLAGACPVRRHRGGRRGTQAAARAPVAAGDRRSARHPRRPRQVVAGAGADHARERDRIPGRAAHRRSVRAAHRRASVEQRRRGADRPAASQAAPVCPACDAHAGGGRADR